MTTLGTMVDRIADELARDDLKTQTEDAIRSAVNHYASERWWFNEAATLTLTLTSSVETYAIPADFESVDDMSILINGNWLEVIQRHYTTITDWQTGITFGQPTDFAIYAQQFYFYPIPDQSLNVALCYIQAVSTLTTTTCTNAFMTYGEELIRSRARADIQLNFLRDEGVTAEYLQVGAAGFYSHRERLAYSSLRRRTTHRLSTGHLRGSNW